MKRNNLSGYVSTGDLPGIIATIAAPFLPTTALTLADINSTKYPGICKASNRPTLEVFYELQRQLNRYAQAKSIAARVAIDGDIGPGVVSLVNKTTGLSPGCTEIALQAVERTVAMKAFADAKGIPAKASSTPVSLKVPSIVDQAGKESLAPAGFMAQFFGRSLSSTESFALVGLAGGIGYLLLTKKKGKKGYRRNPGPGKKRRRRKFPSLKTLKRRGYPADLAAEMTNEYRWAQQRKRRAGK